MQAYSHELVDLHWNRIASMNKAIRLDASKSLVKKRFSKIMSKKQFKIFEELLSVLDDLFPNSYDYHFTYRLGLLELPSSYRFVDTSVLDQYLEVFPDGSFGYSTMGDHIINYPGKLLVEDICIILHYPIINIKNDRNEKHTIQDLYVKLSLDLESNSSKIKLIGDIKGLRATLNRDEAQNKYLHSHLSQKEISSTTNSHFYSFCVGSGQDITLATSNFNITNNTNTFKMFLFMLQTYLEWESFDTNPYHVIRKISGRNYEIVESVNRSEAYSIVKRRIYDNLKINLDWRQKEDAYYYIVDNEKLDKMLEDVKLPDEYYAFKDDAGMFYKETNVITRTIIAPSLETFNFMFRGNLVPFVIKENVSVVENQQNQKFVIPKIKEYVREQLEEEFNTHKTEEIGAKRFSECGY